MSHASSRKAVHHGPEDADIFIIGEFPGKHEDVAQKAIVGPTGDLLAAALSEVGLESTIRYGNVMNYQPAGNKITNANTTWQMEESKHELITYLKTHEHKLIIPMGSYALEFFTGFNSIEKHRGSVYKYNNSYVLPIIHPIQVQQNGSHVPALLHDLAKAKRILAEGWKEPEFNFLIDPHYEVLESLIPKLLTMPRLWVDVETRKYTTHLRCISFAWSPTDAVCIFNESWDSLGLNFARVLRKLLDNDVPKTFHNGMFDTYILEANGINVKGWDYDTLIGQYVLQPELPLGLDYCTSIYTNINYYKDDGKEASDRTSKEVLGVYNCKDTISTCQTQLAQEPEFDEVSRRMFQNKWDQIRIAREFSHTGLYIDQERKTELTEKVLAARGTAYTLFFEVLRMHDLKEDQFFRLGQHKKVSDFLYKTLKLPIKTNPKGKVTADEDAIVSLMGTVKMNLVKLKTASARLPWELKMAALKLILEIRGYEKLLSSYLEAEESSDGRHRSVYNLTGTETDRWSASKWYDNTGLNGQTIPRVTL